MRAKRVQRALLIQVIGSMTDSFNDLIFLIIYEIN